MYSRAWGPLARNSAGILQRGPLGRNSAGILQRGPLYLWRGEFVSCVLAVWKNLTQCITPSIMFYHRDIDSAVIQRSPFRFALFSQHQLGHGCSIRWVCVSRDELVALVPIACDVRAQEVLQTVEGARAVAGILIKTWKRPDSRSVNT